MPRFGRGCGHCLHHALAIARRADAKCQVDAFAQVLQRDRARELHRLGPFEVLPQLGEESLGQLRRSAAHADCVVERELLQIGE